MRVQFGHVVKEEIELAKKALIEKYSLGDGTFEKINIWFEKPHTGNYIKGYPYNDVQEVLEEETTTLLDTFQDMGEVEAYIEEFEYSFSDDDIANFRKIFDEEKIAYMIDGEIDDDKEFLCWNRIEDGQYTWKGTIEEAYNELNEWTGWNKHNNHIELLTIGILK